jgi:hypothetical protein
MTSGADARPTARRLEIVHQRPDDLSAALAAGERALYDDGDLRASRQHFEAAYQLAELAGDVPAMATAAIGLSGLWVSERRTVTGSVMLEARLRHCLSLLDQHSSLALRIRLRLAGEADYVRGGHEEISAVLAEARAAADSVALAEALSLDHHCLLGPEHVAERRELASELIRVSFRTERRSDRMMGLLWQTVDAYTAGDPHAGRLLGELRALLGQQDHPAVAFIVSAIQVMLAIRAGHLDDAEALVHACAERGAAAGDIDAEWWPGAQLVTIRWYQGRVVELLPMLSESVHSPALSAVDDSSVAALAVAAALDGDTRTATSCLARLGGGGLARLPRSSSWLVTMNGIVEAASLLHDAEMAAEAYEELRPYARLPLIGGLGATCFGSTEQALGLAALTGGQLDQSIAHLQTAVRDNIALGHWPAVVSARQRLARALRERGRPADREAADRELRAGAAEAVALGVRQPSDPATSQAGGDDAGLESARGDGAHGDVARGGSARGGSARGGSAECLRQGRKWRLSLDDRAVLVEDSVGMLHLAVLIANPRREIPAAELAAGLAALAGAGPAGASAQPVLDQQAVAAYRSRLSQLQAELDAREAAGGDEQEAAGPGSQANLAQDEREWLASQLTSAAGLAGRTRSFPDDGERARVAVGKAIRRAVTRIEAADPVIGAHLRGSLHTGVRCSYWPG